jgi:hypothetical protein
MTSALTKYSATSATAPAPMRAATRAIGAAAHMHADAKVAAAHELVPPPVPAVSVPAQSLAGLALAPAPTMARTLAPTLTPASARGSDGKLAVGEPAAKAAAARVIAGGGEEGQGAAAGERRPGSAMSEESYSDSDSDYTDATTDSRPNSAAATPTPAGR